tara:strand:+ start:84 stop:671 length:588 start_codon:yes stop_codon:yes gene_type:complete
MKVLSKFFMLSSIVLALFLTSCSGDDGADGIDGIDGVDGVDGANGAQGIPGENGADGNANAAVLYYDTTALSGTNFALDVPEFTEQLLIQSTVLVYAQIASTHYSVPGTIGFGISTGLNLNTGLALISFYNTDDATSYAVTEGGVDAVKIVIIDSSSFDTRVASKSANAKDVLSVLKADGVDVNDYNAVAAYFNL